MTQNSKPLAPPGVQGSRRAGFALLLGLLTYYALVAGQALWVIALRHTLPDNFQEHVRLFAIVFPALILAACWKAVRHRDRLPPGVWTASLIFGLVAAAIPLWLLYITP